MWSSTEEGRVGWNWNKMKKKKKKHSELQPLWEKQVKTAGICITISITTWGFPALKTPSVWKPQHKRANLSPLLSKAHPILGGTEKAWKASEVSSCPPADATIHKQLFELEVFYQGATMCVPLTGCHAFKAGVGREDSGLCSPQLLSVQFLRITQPATSSWSLSLCHPFICNLQAEAKYSNFTTEFTHFHFKKGKFYIKGLMVS